MTPQLPRPAGTAIVNPPHWIFLQLLLPVRQAISRHNAGLHAARRQGLRSASGRLRRLLGSKAKSDKPDRKPNHLLIVDDEEAICFSMQEYFSLHGFAVDTAREAEEAERLIEKTDYKVIIQDLRLGRRKGTEGLEVVRFAHQQSPATRIVVLTAYGSAENEIEAKRSGADAFLTKPQPLSQLAQIITNLIVAPPRPAGH